jgi:hypothetical protein
MNLQEEILRIKGIMGVISEQSVGGLRDYLNQLMENPTEFTNKLNSDQEFKNSYIKSFQTFNEPGVHPFNLLENVKLVHILKHRTVPCVIKNMETNTIIKEVEIKSVEEYNEYENYVKTQKSKGEKLTIICSTGKLYGTPNGDEIANALNIALGQKWFN